MTVWHRIERARRLSTERQRCVSQRVDHVERVFGAIEGNRSTSPSLSSIDSNSNLQLNQKHRMAQTNTSGSSEGHHIPWDLMKADTLRAVLRDLGVKPPAGKREDMLASLRGIEKNGCMCSTVLLLRCAYAMFISGCSDV